MAEDILRRTLSDRELTQLQETGRVGTLGGFTLAALLVACNTLGIGPEDVEVSGNGRNYGVELFVVGHPSNEETSGG